MTVTQTEHRPLKALLRRGWILVVVGTIVGIAAGVALYGGLTKRYTATASVLVTPTGVNDNTASANGRTTGAVNLDTEVQLVTASGVVREVQALDPSARPLDLKDLTRPVTVTVPANTTILNISYTDVSPVVAADRANDFANAYLIERKNAADSTLNDELSKAQASLSTLDVQFKSISATLEALPKKSTQLPLVHAQRGLLLGQITNVNNTITALSTTAITPGRVLTNAIAPTSPSSPSKVLLLSAGLAGGVLIGLLAAWLRFAFTRRFHHRDDVEQHLRIPVIGAVPSVSEGPDPEASATLAGHYRRIANVVRAAQSEPGVVVITGQVASSVLDRIATALAAAMVRNGTPARVDAEPVSGPSNDRLPDATTSYTFVAIADPAHAPDAQTCAASAQAVVLILAARSRIQPSRLALRELDAVGAPILGAVLVPSARWWDRAPRPTRSHTSSSSEPAESRPQVKLRSDSSVELQGSTEGREDAVTDAVEAATPADARVDDPTADPAKLSAHADGADGPTTTAERESRRRVRRPLRARGGDDAAFDAESHERLDGERDVDADNGSQRDVDERRGDPARAHR